MDDRVVGLQAFEEAANLGYESGLCLPETGQYHRINMGGQVCCCAIGSAVLAKKGDTFDFRSQAAKFFNINETNLRGIIDGFDGEPDNFILENEVDYQAGREVGKRIRERRLK